MVTMMPITIINTPRSIRDLPVAPICYPSTVSENQRPAAAKIKFDAHAAIMG